MSEQIYFEDINVGDELPVVARDVVRLQDVVRNCGAIDNYTQWHYDEAFAKSVGLPNMLVPAPLRGAYMFSAITNWAGEWGTLKSMTQRCVFLLPPGDAANFKGNVAKKYTKEGENYVELDIRLENRRGVATDMGTAVVTLPSRPSK